jgi:hypothetical protein
MAPVRVEKISVHSGVMLSPTPRRMEVIRMNTNITGMESIRTRA